MSDNQTVIQPKRIGDVVGIRYEIILPYIKEPIRGIFRNYFTIYDSTGFYAIEIESAREPDHQQIYLLIRQSGFSGGVYSLKIYHTEKISENSFKALFAAAGLDMALPNIKE